MFKKPFRDEITKDTILKYIAQEEIFEHYLGVKVQYTKQIRNPLRKDKTPTCAFKWIKSKLYFRDFSEERALDCFDIVQRKYACNFGKALNQIAKDFNLIEGSSLTPKKIIDVPVRSEGRKVFEVNRQPFTQIDSKYLTTYSLTGDTLRRFYTFSVKDLYINGEIKYIYNSRDPAIGYYLGRDKKGVEEWKIYFYTRKKSSKRPKFLSNTSRWNGLFQIISKPLSTDFIVITKSMKDVMVLHELGIDSIAPQSESTIISEALYNRINKKYETVYSLFDNDSAGIISSEKMADRFGIRTRFIQDDKAKDISDYVKEYGKQAAVELTKKMFT